ncbi:hypothetical protein FACS1894186_8570 [Alphaproteobacteria bacterium]|nr:hypothetical protein FACS1894186_8570 [Alphaproteobacteria bacterium]
MRYFPVLIAALAMLPCAAGAQYLEISGGANQPITELKRPPEKPLVKTLEPEAVKIEYKPNSLEGAALRMDDIGGQISYLTGEIENLQRRQADIESRFATLQADKDVRLRELEEKVKALEARPAPSPESAPLAPKPDAKKAYQDAYDKLQAKKYAESETGFAAFLKAYPKHDLAAAAQYWLGESFYARGLWDKAAVAFGDGVKKYKSSSKAPDCLLKLGLSMGKLSKKNEACAAFTNLGAEFPKASADIKKKAKEEAAKAKCDA